MEPISDPSLDSDEYEEEPLDGYEGETDAGTGQLEDFDEPGPDDEDEEL